MSEGRKYLAQAVMKSPLQVKYIALLLLSLLGHRVYYFVIFHAMKYGI
jgi:hypothetical protein